MTAQTQPAPGGRVEAAKESFLSRLLDPLDRLVESIYSVLIVLTFTLAYRVADAQGVLANETVSQLMRNLFWASFGCAVAWGLIKPPAWWCATVATVASSPCRC